LGPSVVSTAASIYFPAADLISSEFGTYSYAYRIVHLYFGMQSVIWTYFAGFCCVEANLIASGFGYTRKEI